MFTKVSTVIIVTFVGFYYLREICYTCKPVVRFSRLVCVSPVQLLVARTEEALRRRLSSLGSVHTARAGGTNSHFGSIGPNRGNLTK